MIRVLVVDDEAPARKKIVRLLSAAADFQVVGEAVDGRAAARAIAELQPDLVFLDVKMPGLDGFGVIEEVGPRAMPLVVFVTAFDQHALEAFEVQALDYLLKPVSPERFRAVLERARKQLRRGRVEDLADRLEKVLERVGSAYLRKVLVRERGRAFLLPVEEIDWMEAEGNYVRLHARDGSHLVRSRLGGLAERLDPAQFLRIGRSQVVRLDAVKEFQPWFHGDQQVVLKDGTVLSWSRRYRTKGVPGLDLE